MAYADKEDRARALKAVLDMIDSKAYELETRKQREEAVKNIMDENKLTCWGGAGRNRVRILYPPWLVFSQFGQLPNYLKDGVQETVPKTEVIWISGSSVIKPEYLKKSLLYDVVPTVDNNLEENQSQNVDPGEKLIIPQVCSGISGSEDCEGPNHHTLYHTGDGGFYCKPCVKYAILEEDTPAMIGGCSNPFRSPKCKGTELDKPNFYSDRVLCSPCKTLVMKQEKDKAAAAEERDSLMAEQSTMSTAADAPESPRRVSAARLEIMRESITPEPEQPLSTTNAARATAETVLPALVELDAVDSSSGGPIVQARPQQSLTIHLKAVKLNGESQNQHKSSENSSTTSRKRAAEPMSNHPAEVQHKRPRESIRDELHQDGNTGTAVAHIQKEMDTILEILREIVMIFHLINQLDANEPARIMEQDELSKYPAMMAAYLETVGPDDRHWCELSLDNNLTSSGFLTALLGAMLYQQVFPMDLSIPCETCPASTIDALKADLRHSDDDWTSFRARLRFREVQSHAFQENVTKSIAPDAAGKIIFALQPHFRVMTGSNMRRIPTTEWLTEFSEKLTKSIKRALLLKARLQVAPERYEMTWFASDSYYERTMMEAKEAPPEGDYRIARRYCQAGS